MQRSTALVFAGIVLFAIGVMLVVWITVDGPGRDVREVRHFGGLECVYNVDTDKVEACAK